MQAARTTGTPILLAIGLTLLVAAVFHPMLRFEFVQLDVAGQVLENPHVQGLSWQNVKQIFSSRCSTSYYPVRSLTYALDYQWWGLDPRGFKLTNGLIHAANVLLVFWLAVRLLNSPAVAETSPASWRKALPAALAAGCFALHPVVVEPVAWVAGREELLMTLGALSCVHFHLTARRLTESGGKSGWILCCHAMAAAACAAACLSNAVGAVIPLLIVAVDVVTLSRPSVGRIVSGTAALWLIGAATVMIKKVGEFRDPPGEAAALSLERLAVVLNVYWLNLQTLFWPGELAVFYDSVEPDGWASAGVLLGGVAAALTCAACWAARRQPAMLLGLVWFVVALAPSSQILVHHIHRADRFLYLPLAGLALAMAAGLRALLGFHRLFVPAATLAGGSLALLVLAGLSSVQLRTWQNAGTMWENCVQVNPGSVKLRIELAEWLAQRGQHSAAVARYEQALRLRPEHEMASVKLAWLLATRPDPGVGDHDRARQLVSRVYDQNPVFFRAAANVYREVAKTQAAEGAFAAAADGYRYALQLDPGNHRAMFQLAWLLATCRDDSLRCPAEAVEIAERGRLVCKQPGAWELSVLAAAYAAAGQADLAASTAEQAIGLAQAAGDVAALDEIRSRLERQVPHGR